MHSMRVIVCWTNLLIDPDFKAPRTRVNNTQIGRNNALDRRNYACCVVFDPIRFAKTPSEILPTRYRVCVQ